MAEHKLPHVGWGEVVMAGAELIAARGIARTELSDVAEHAGADISDVSYWFADPGQVLVAVMEIRKNWFLDHARARMASRQTHTQRLRELIEMTIADGEATYWIELFRLASRNDEARQARQRLSDEYRRGVAAVIRAGQREGEFGSASPDKVALVLSSLLTGFSMNLTLNDPDVTRESTLATMLGVCERLLRVEFATPTD
jgi:AcrR family transcriptional regulator